MDYLVRGMARNDKVRIIGCECKDTVNEICKRHETYPIATIALGRLICATLMMGAMLKDKQTVTCVINGGGKLGTLFTQANARGETRGFVSDPSVDLSLKDNKWDIEDGVGNNGVLTVIKNFDEDKSFSSQVRLNKGDISSDIATYFYESEQLPTVVNLNVELNKDGSVSSARGYIIQLMTGYEEEDLEYVENLKLASLDKKVDDCILEMFSDFKRLENTPVKFTCDCSKEKFENGLKSLKKEELQKILEEDKQIEVMCNFCSEKYLFNEDEIKKIIEK